MKLADGKNGLGGLTHVDGLLVAVEARDDPYAEILEAVIVQKGASELAGAHQNRVCQPFTPEMAFNVGNQLIGFIADLGLARARDSRKILTDLNVAQG